MLNKNNIKTFQGLKYYTGAHPIIRAQNKSSSRPTDFGHKVWASSLVFMDFLSTASFNLKNKKVLELGCGWGILGLYMAKQFNCQVICSDKDEKVLPIVESHAKLNSLDVATLASSFSSITNSQLKAVNVLMGVEVCYSLEAANELTDLFVRSHDCGVEQIFIADPGRPDFIETICSNSYKYSSKIFKLAGTINGKTTHVLHLFKDS